MPTAKSSTMAMWYNSPCASEFPGLVPDLLELRVVLDDDGVLDEAALRRRRPEAVVDVGAHAARAQRDVERHLRLPQARRHVHAVHVRVVTGTEIFIKMV